MSMKRCNNGHFYDDAKHPSCPYCGISDMDASKTMPIIAPASSAPKAQETIGRTVAMAPQESAPGRTSAADEGKTVAIMKKEKGIDPVVGWVVCIEGPSKGQDYRIKSERNFIGRDSSMDIVISGDNTISRENHASISYNPKNSSFRLLPGDSHGLVYLNDEDIYTPTELKKGDIIELGETKLIFVPLCEGGFTW
ncbi:MAG: FHA domain-containing protein [Clostridia bacterium]|nr:FHA domain-containing protein [Clostridia bacterium]